MKSTHDHSTTESHDGAPAAASQQGLRAVWTFSRASLAAISVAYAVAFLLWRGLLLTPLVAQIWQLQLSVVFAPWSFLPLLPLGVLALLLRSRVSLVALLVPFVFFAAEYGRQFLPNWHLYAQPAVDSRQMRVMTWNMLYTADRSGAFRQTVRDLDPDIVALQEVGYRLSNDLTEWFADEYPHQVVQSAGNSTGLALLSRYPIREVAPRDVTLYGCICQQVTLDVDGQPVTLINAHPWSPDVSYGLYRRLPQVYGFSTAQQDVLFTVLTQRVAAIDGPLLLVGDLNTTVRQSNLRRLQPYVQDSYAQVGWGFGFTYPSPRPWRGPLRLFPLVRIDHVMHSEHWQARTARTGAIEGSDHLFVVVDLALRP